MRIGDSTLPYRSPKGPSHQEHCLQEEGEKSADRVILSRDETEESADTPYPRPSTSRGHNALQLGLLALTRARPSEQAAFFGLWEDNPLKKFYSRLKPDHKPGLLVFQSWEFAEQQGWHDPITWTIGALPGKYAGKPWDDRENQALLQAALPLLDSTHPVTHLVKALSQGDPACVRGAKEALVRALDAVSQGGPRVPPLLLAVTAAQRGALPALSRVLEEMEFPDHPATRLLRNQTVDEPEWALLGQIGSGALGPALLKLSRSHLLPCQLVITQAALEALRSHNHSAILETASQALSTDSPWKGFLHGLSRLDQGGETAKAALAEFDQTGSYSDARMAAWRAAPETQKATINQLARDFLPTSDILGAAAVPLELKLDPNFLSVGGHSIPLEND